MPIELKSLIGLLIANSIEYKIEYRGIDAYYPWYIHGLDSGNYYQFKWQIVYSYNNSNMSHFDKINIPVWNRFPNELIEYIKSETIIH